MSGIYIHIPFCKQACHYCNFHFSTSLQHKTPLLQAIVAELSLRSNYLPTTTLQSIYIGGGTPSLLSSAELQTLFDAIARHYHWTPDTEITLEANPDDLSPAYLAQLRRTPVNRLSIGIQSFNDADLQFMHRAHHARQADHCIQAAQDAGFEQLSIDLIYGSPTTTNAVWQANLAQATAYQIPHLSAYCLTVEPRTALHRFVERQQVPAPSDEQAAQQFEMLLQHTAEAGYWHYEISNFCQPEQFARHNTAYWQGKPYLGVGPSAHSFNGSSRQWNVAHNPQYIAAVQAGNLPSEIEQLSPQQQFNEYLLTSLRTMWGCDLAHVAQQFGSSYVRHLQQHLPSLQAHLLPHHTQHLILNTVGKLRADAITADLFVDAHFGNAL